MKKLLQFSFVLLLMTTLSGQVSTINETFSPPGFQNGDMLPKNGWTTDKVSGPMALISDGKLLVFPQFSYLIPIHIVTPELTQISGNYILKFDANFLAAPGVAAPTFEVGTSNAPAEVGTDFSGFNKVADFTLTGTSETYSIVLPSTADKYIVFKCIAGTENLMTYIDNVSYEPVPAPQQMELKVLTDWGSRIYDINDSGTGIFSGAYYDFATGTVTPTENGEATNRLNNAGDVAGAMAFTSSEGEELGQAGYRKNGTWNAIGYFPGDVPGNSWFSNANDISPNSKYVTGQISSSVGNSYAFLYDTETGTNLKFDGDGSFEYGRGEAVNSSGVVAGFVNKYSINGSTYWIPAYYTPDKPGQPEGCHECFGLRFRR